MMGKKKMAMKRGGKVKGKKKAVKKRGGGMLKKRGGGMMELAGVVAACLRWQWVVRYHLVKKWLWAWQ